jgi:hypothetical protein
MGFRCLFFIYHNTHYLSTIWAFIKKDLISSTNLQKMEKLALKSNLRCGNLTDAGFWSCRGWVLLGGLGVVVLGCGASLVVVMTSVRSVVVRSSSFLTASTFGGGSPLTGSPTLQNDVVQRQAVTPDNKQNNWKSFINGFTSPKV